VSVGEPLRTPPIDLSGKHFKRPAKRFVLSPTSNLLCSLVPEPDIPVKIHCDDPKRCRFGQHRHFFCFHPGVGQPDSFRILLTFSTHWMSSKLSTISVSLFQEYCSFTDRWSLKGLMQSLRLSPETSILFRSASPTPCSAQ